MFISPFGFICLHFSKVLKEIFSFAQKSTKLNFVKLVKITNSSPFYFLHARPLNGCICPVVCSVVMIQARGMLQGYDKWSSWFEVSLEMCGVFCAWIFDTFFKGCHPL